MNAPRAAANAPATGAEPSSWLPDFCHPRVSLAVLALAEIVLLVVLFAPGDGLPHFAEISTGTLLVQWLGVCALVALCAARDTLAKQSVATSVALAYTVVLTIVGLGSVAAITLDRQVELGLTDDLGPLWMVVGQVLAVTTLVMTASMRYFYVRAQWQHQVKEQARAQVQALQARIRPHFLFNSMNTIASLIATRPEAAERAVEDLSELFRAALAVGDQLSDLGRELDLIEHYLAIERWRLGPRLAVEQDTAALPRNLPIPSLLLQPLVENAVLHGIQSLTAGGTVRIAGEVLDESVRISIENPKAIDAAPGAARLSRGNGIALDNIRQRLRYHFEDRAQLEVDAGADYYRCRVTLPRGP